MENLSGSLSLFFRSISNTESVLITSQVTFEETFATLLYWRCPHLVPPEVKKARLPLLAAVVRTAYAIIISRLIKRWLTAHRDKKLNPPVLTPDTEHGSVEGIQVTRISNTPAISAVEPVTGNQATSLGFPQHDRAEASSTQLQAFPVFTGSGPHRYPASMGADSKAWAERSQASGSESGSEMRMSDLAKTRLVRSRLNLSEFAVATLGDARSLSGDFNAGQSAGQVFGHDRIPGMPDSDEEHTSVEAPGRHAFGFDVDRRSDDRRRSDVSDHRLSFAADQGNGQGMQNPADGSAARRTTGARADRQT